MLSQDCYFTDVTFSRHQATSPSCNFSMYIIGYSFIQCTSFFYPSPDRTLLPAPVMLGLTHGTMAYYLSPSSNNWENRLKGGRISPAPLNRLLPEGRQVDN